ncbi:hypothetical protein TRVA0_001S01156 [Trichomonascus vanleenenianus]|uniref:uncharacterized protein n=1 Tax=Trichomonascus vanleenenianus TaxID=2268995 RepID=UPI003ECB9020
MSRFKGGLKQPSASPSQNPPPIPIPLRDKNKTFFLPGSSPLCVAEFGFSSSRPMGLRTHQLPDPGGHPILGRCPRPRSRGVPPPKPPWKRRLSLPFSRYAESQGRGGLKLSSVQPSLVVRRMSRTNWELCAAGATSPKKKPSSHRTWGAAPDPVVGGFHPPNPPPSLNSDSPISPRSGATGGFGGTGPPQLRKSPPFPPRSGTPRGGSGVSCACASSWEQKGACATSPKSGAMTFLERRARTWRYNAKPMRAVDARPRWRWRARDEGSDDLSQIYLYYSRIPVHHHHLLFFPTEQDPASKRTR